jgi:hypothetical protein
MILVHAKEVVQILGRSEFRTSDGLTVRMFIKKQHIVLTRSVVQREMLAKKRQ